jgi:hypothetical protein
VNGDFVKVAVLEDEDQARLLGLILTEKGIPYRMHTYYDTAFDGLFQTQKGWGHISAPRSWHGAVMEVIHDLRASLRDGEADDPET